MRTISMILAASLVACASASDPASEPLTPREATQRAPGVDVPRHTLAGEQSPGAAFGSNYSWASTGKTPNECASARFVRDGRFITDSMTNQQWGAEEALTFTPKNDADAGVPKFGGAEASGLCAVYFSGTHAASSAELVALRAAVPGCPLPGAFYSVDLWRMTTSDDKCFDLKTGAEALDDAMPPAPVPTGKCGSTSVDVSRAALCVK